MKKTIGGDRLGAGNKMKVELHNYGRSTHNMGYLFRTTMSAGTLVPFMKEIALPGDTFDIDLNCKVLTHPTVGPLFGSYKVQLDIFQCPIRLYQGQLHNNKLGIGLHMETVKFPLLKLRAVRTAPTDPQPVDIDNYQVNPSSILAYLGIRGAGTNREGVDNDVWREFNGLPYLMYWDIYKNYYSNKQEEIGAVIHSTPVDKQENVSGVAINGTTLNQDTMGATPLVLNNGAIITIAKTLPADQDLNQVLIFAGSTLQDAREIPLGSIVTQTGSTAGFQTTVYNNTFGTMLVFFWFYSTQLNQPQSAIDITTFPLSQIDEMREAILMAVNTAPPFDINAFAFAPYNLIFEENSDQTYRSIVSSQEGLGLKTYNSDLLNNWLSTEWIDGVNGINELTAVDTSGGSFTMDTLALAKKVYDMMNRIAISGGTYDDWQDAVYTHDRYTKAETPIYHGGLIKELEFQEVVSTAEQVGVAAGGAGTTGSGQPLGTLAGKGRMADKHKGGSVTIRIDEPSYVIGIVSLTPRLDYSQGNDWDVHLQTMNDLHKPALDEIGFQELLTEQMAWWDTYWSFPVPGGAWITKSAGKQPAWINYMTNINRVRGNFAIKDNEMFMTLNRGYTADIDNVLNTVNIKDLTTYIDPRIYNSIFADTSLDSQNFWTQIGVKMDVRRKISAKIMPNL